MPEEALLKRVLPHSMEAEQSVIGSMIMDREAIVTASEIVQGEDFYNKQYGVLFDTMVELNDEGKPVDPITLQDRLREKDVPPEISSAEFIAGLIAGVPTSANIKKESTLVAPFLCQLNVKSQNSAPTYSPSFSGFKITCAPRIPALTAISSKRTAVSSI